MASDIRALSRRSLNPGFAAHFGTDGEDRGAAFDAAADALLRASCRRCMRTGLLRGLEACRRRITMAHAALEDSVDKRVNLIKLCVGAETVDDLLEWQRSARAKGPDGLPRHVTRMRPKRSEEILNGGSLYWVFKGSVLARQRILRLDEERGADGVLRCALVLDPEVRRTEAVPKRPFQGWRYLPPERSPRDLPVSRTAEPDLPPRMVAALAEIGIR